MHKCTHVACFVHTYMHTLLSLQLVSPTHSYHFFSLSLRSQPVEDKKVKTAAEEDKEDSSTARPESLDSSTSRELRPQEQHDEESRNSSLSVSIEGPFCGDPGSSTPTEASMTSGTAPFPRRPGPIRCGSFSEGGYFSDMSDGVSPGPAGAPPSPLPEPDSAVLPGMVRQRSADRCWDDADDSDPDAEFSLTKQQLRDTLSYVCKLEGPTFPLEAFSVLHFLFLSLKVFFSLRSLHESQAHWTLCSPTCRA